jgi:predicted extracellular nuclease
MSTRRATLAAAAAVTVLGAAPIPAAQGCGGGVGCIQVGTFNIENFGNEQRHAPRSDALVDEIADVISQRLDLEVVALEEIDAKSEDYARLRSRLEERGWRLAAGASGGTQNVIIAWDTREVQLIEHGAEGVGELPVPAEIDLGGGCKDDLRRPLAGHFRAGRFDFVLVGLHLKSQIPPQGQPEECADRIRAEQSRLVAVAANDLARRLGEDDVVIIGDLNEVAGQTSMRPFAEAGFDDLSRPVNRAPESLSISYLKAPYRTLIDHALVRRRATREWVPQSTVAWGEADNARWVREISDHAPVFTSFLTDRDLD